MVNYSLSRTCRSEVFWLRLTDVSDLDIIVYIFPRIKINYVCKCFACMYATCVVSICRSWKALNSIEMELWIAVNHYVGFGNQTRILCKCSQCT